MFVNSNFFNSHAVTTEHNKIMNWHNSGRAELRWRIRCTIAKQFTPRCLHSTPGTCNTTGRRNGRGANKAAPFNNGLLNLYINHTTFLKADQPIEYLRWSYRPRSNFNVCNVPFECHSHQPKPCTRNVRLWYCC